MQGANMSLGANRYGVSSKDRTTSGRCKGFVLSDSGIHLRVERIMAPSMNEVINFLSLSHSLQLQEEDCIR